MSRATRRGRATFAARLTDSIREDTVVVPPAGPLQPNTEIRARLAELDRAEATAQVDIL